MAKRSRSRSARRFTGFRRGARRMGGRVGGFFRGGIMGQITGGLGAAVVATLILSRVAPQWTQIGSLGASYLGGGIPGVISQAVVGGGLGNLGGLFGGSSATTTMDSL